MTKTCTKCLQTKPVLEFGRHRKAKDGLSWICKSCNKLHSKKWASENKDKVIAYRRKYRPIAVERRKWQLRLTEYGVTQEMFYDMLTDQNGRCKICCDEFVKEPHVDHCHSTGRVRGLLCSRCNTALGLARDSTEILTRMIAYLSEDDEV